MRKTQKEIFGLFGLILVAAMTVFAASLPSPNAAAEGSGVVDTVIIRVVGSQPNVYFTSPDNESSFVGPNQIISYNFENIKSAVLTMTYFDGTTTYPPYTLDTMTDITDQSGTGTYNIDLSSYGYGEYTINVTGEGPGGVEDFDVITFSYYPITATVEQEEENGDPSVILEYDDNNTDIDRIEINVYDEDGNLVSALSPTTVLPDDKNVLLPFAENNIPAGQYRIETTAYDVNGDPLYSSYGIIHTYEPKVTPAPDEGGDEEEEEDMVVPNTGGLFETMNISQSDYLITGLMIFFITGIGGAIFIAKSRNSKR